MSPKRTELYRSYQCCTLFIPLANPAGLDDGHHKTARQSYLDRIEIRIHLLQDKMKGIDTVFSILSEEFREMYGAVLDRIFPMNVLEEVIFARISDEGDVGDIYEGYGDIPRGFPRYHYDLLSGFKTILQEHGEMVNLIPRKRLSMTRRAVKEHLISYFGSPVGDDGFKVDIKSLRTYRGLYYTLRAYFDEKIKNHKLRSLILDRVNHVIMMVVCPFCPKRNTALSMVHDAGPLVYEDVIFVLHMLETHSDSCQDPWDTLEIIVSGSLIRKSSYMAFGYGFDDMMAEAGKCLFNLLHEPVYTAWCEPENWERSE